MKKTLITVRNLSEYIHDNKLVVKTDMIITPGAKDKIRIERIEVEYEKSCCEVENKKVTEKQENKNCQQLDRKVIELLVKEYNITNPDAVQKILSRLKELL